jgi:hypothetical protein
LNFELPEPYAVKVSCTVLAGESGSNAAELLSYLKQWQNAAEQRISLVSKPLPVGFMRSIIN